MVINSARARATSRGVESKCVQIDTSKGGGAVASSRGRNSFYIDQTDVFLYFDRAVYAWDGATWRRQKRRKNNSSRLRLASEDEH